MSPRFLAPIALAAALAGCGAPGGGGDRAALELGGEVRHWGSLRGIIAGTDTAAAVSLASLTPDSALYAVGALAGLAGEVTVLGGEVWLATPEEEGDGAVSLAADSSSRGAALLVAARVPSWRDVAIEVAIPFDSLAARVAALAAGAGVDTAAPFPFVIEGPLSALEWHVVDGRRLPDGATGHEAHLAAAIRRRLDHVSAGLVGFHSTAHEGMWTHRGAFTHVHAVIPAAQASGHVDRVVVEPGATLRVPAR